MLAVAQTHFAADSCRRLAFPMDQLTADRMIAIARRQREAAEGLVQGERRHIRRDMRNPSGSGLPRHPPSTVAAPEADAVGIEGRGLAIEAGRHNEFAQAWWE